MPRDPRFMRNYNPDDRYYVIIFSLYHGALVVQSRNIRAIIVAIRAAKEEGFLYLASDNAVDKMQEMMREMN